MKQSILYLAPDVHKNSIAVALAGNGHESEVRCLGTIGGGMAALDKAARQFVSLGKSLRFVYETGPCGYGICRHLTRQGFDCAVVAPSLIPKKSGNRIKNDRRGNAPACIVRGN